MDKIAKVREELEKKKAKAIVVNMLDEIAWLFNIRGTDIDFNPGMFLCFLFDSRFTFPTVFFAYAVVTANSVVLFLNESQLDQSAKSYLKDHVEIKPYDAFFDYLKQLPPTLELNEDSVCSDDFAVSAFLKKSFAENSYWRQSQSSNC